jgi:hypothetical protein
LLVGELNAFSAKRWPKAQGNNVGDRQLLAKKYANCTAASVQGQELQKAEKAAVKLAWYTGSKRQACATNAV